MEPVRPSKACPSSFLAVLFRAALHGRRSGWRSEVKAKKI
jgi:hypothetical protein